MGSAYGPLGQSSGDLLAVDDRLHHLLDACATVSWDALLGEVVEVT